jgi:hypothetical protein
MYTSYLIIALLAGLASFLIAKEKGLDPVKWFIIGFLASLAGLAIITLVKKKIGENKKKNP